MKQEQNLKEEIAYRRFNFRLNAEIVHLDNHQKIASNQEEEDEMEYERSRKINDIYNRHYHIIEKSMMPEDHEYYKLYNQWIEILEKEAGFSQFSNC